ncbi:MAG TPA: ATP-grasp domain-containing protein [Jatrophihabitantaceae bacterium]|jgi:formate-dependent phosphoribosylglycinamide formyltransferase (GAR transformylase)
MNVVFVEPAFPANQREFVRALADVGATVIGVGERHVNDLDGQLKDWMFHYEQVGSVTDVGAMTDVVRRAQSQLWIDRLEATIEAHTLPAAQVREACGIPGTSVHTAWLCRDKPSMKQALREAGVPTAASTAASTAAEVREFAEQIGYPLILKPRSGAGAADTTRVDSAADLERALGSFGGVDSIAVEEFVEGHEGFYDTLTVDGRVSLDFVSHYYPNVLEAMRTRWISPQFISTNRIDTAPEYEELREMGRRVIDALGIGTSATHMEWFFGPKGLRFSEIGCRPPGVGAWDLYSAGNDFDLFREWANAIVHGRTFSAPSRRFSSGMIAVRPETDGHITGYSGVDELQAQFGQWVIDAHLPTPGTPTQPVAAGYMANAYVRMRHPDYDTLRAMLETVGRTLTVHAA